MKTPQLADRLAQEVAKVEDLREENARLRSAPRQSFSEDHVRMRLEDAVKSHPRGQKGWASDRWFSPAYVNDVLHGRRRVSQTMAAALGFELVVTFIPRADLQPVAEAVTS